MLAHLGFFFFGSAGTGTAGISIRSPLNNGMASSRRAPSNSRPGHRRAPGRRGRGRPTSAQSGGQHQQEGETLHVRAPLSMASRIGMKASGGSSRNDLAPLPNRDSNSNTPLLVPVGVGAGETQSIAGDPSATSPAAIAAVQPVLAFLLI